MSTTLRDKYPDLVLFDPEKITDRATIEDPQSLSEGIVGVWENGEGVWEGGRVLDARPGSLIKNSDYPGQKPEGK